MYIISHSTEDLEGILPMGITPNNVFLEHNNYLNHLLSICLEYESENDEEIVGSILLEHSNLTF